MVLGQCNHRITKILKFIILKKLIILTSVKKHYYQRHFSRPVSSWDLREIRPPGTDVQSNKIKQTKVFATDITVTVLIATLIHRGKCLNKALMFTPPQPFHINDVARINLKSRSRIS